MKSIFVLTGAGVSKESGIPTFRDSKDGLWHNYNIMEVASPEGLKKNPKLVLDFYNDRRRAVRTCIPNDGHHYLAKLQDYFSVSIYTQNIDDLHEKAGSINVFHIHGDITKARSIKDDSKIIDIGYNDINIGDLHEDGEQLRPNVVFFDEFIQYEEEMARACVNSDIVLVVGTSLTVYPAAKFPSRYRRDGVPLYIVDPGEYMIQYKEPLMHIKKPASEGMKELYELLVSSETK